MDGTKQKEVHFFLLILTKPSHPLMSNMSAKGFPFLLMTTK